MVVLMQQIFIVGYHNPLYYTLSLLIRRKYKGVESTPLQYFTQNHLNVHKIDGNIYVYQSTGALGADRAFYTVK